MPTGWAPGFGAAVVGDVLKFARGERCLGAAVAAAEILGEIGKADEVLRGEEPTPLVEALRDPDRRVRMAAVAAIVRLQPAVGFAGSSRALEALCFFAAGGTGRRALVAGPNVDALREMAEMLSSLGYRDRLGAHAGGRQSAWRLPRPTMKSPFSTRRSTIRRSCSCCKSFATTAARRGCGSG